MGAEDLLVCSHRVCSTRLGKVRPPPSLSAAPSCCVADALEAGVSVSDAARRALSLRGAGPLEPEDVRPFEANEIDRTLLLVERCDEGWAGNLRARAKAAVAHVTVIQVRTRAENHLAAPARRKTWAPRPKESAQRKRAQHGRLGRPKEIGKSNPSFPSEPEVEARSNNVEGLIAPCHHLLRCSRERRSVHQISVTKINVQVLNLERQVVGHGVLGASAESPPELKPVIARREGTTGCAVERRCRIVVHKQKGLVVELREGQPPSGVPGLCPSEGGVRSRRHKPAAESGRADGC